MTAAGPVTVDALAGLRATLLAAPEAASLRDIGLREVVRGPGSVRALPDVLSRLGVADGSAVTVLTDATPKRYEDEDVLDVVRRSLEGRLTAMVAVVASEAPAHGVLADEATVARAVDLVRRGEPAGLVSVGSGTVADIAKVVARDLALTHVVVQTAASVNGFADDQSVLLINGAKRTTATRWPDALVVDPLVVARAPGPMTRSGLGDALSMFSASADWYLASAVGVDTSFSPALVGMMRAGVDDLMAAGPDLGDGRPEAVAALADCLTRGGIAMGAAGRTAPSSGLEHAVSHLLEMRADAAGVPSAAHGAQVGVASVLAALAWRRLRRRLDDRAATPDAARLASRERVAAAFDRLDATGATTEECWRLYSRKSDWIRGHLDEVSRAARDWPTHARVIDRLLRPAESVAAALSSAGAPVTFDELDPAPDGSTARWALANCHLMRDRFGVIDFAELLGAWGDEDVDAVLAELREVAR